MNRVEQMEAIQSKAFELFKRKTPIMEMRLLNTE